MRRLTEEECREIAQWVGEIFHETKEEVERLGRILDEESRRKAKETVDRLFGSSR